MKLRKLIREPLLHFLAIGAGLFWLFNIVSSERGGVDHRIVVTDATVAALVDHFRGVWMRPPADAELRGLVATYVREEVLYRDAISRGLDRDDPVVRRRVLQKLDVLAEESAASSAPTDAELEAYLRANATRYVRPAIIGFDQVQFDSDKRGARTNADIAAAITQLRAGADPGKFGDHSLLPPHVEPIPRDQVAREFGDRFADALINLPVGSWVGPLASSQADHLVRINSLDPARAATLAEARQAVARDWENDRRTRASSDYFQNLRRQYTVVYETTSPVNPASDAPQ